MTFKGFCPQISSQVQEAIAQLRAEVIQWHQKLATSYQHGDKWALGQFLRKASEVDPSANRKGSIYGFLKWHYFCQKPGMDTRAYQPQSKNDQADLIAWASLKVEWQHYKPIADAGIHHNPAKGRLDEGTFMEQMKAHRQLEKIQKELKLAYSFIMANSSWLAAVLDALTLAGVDRKVARRSMATYEGFQSLWEAYDSMIPEWLAVAIVATMIDISEKAPNRPQQTLSGLMVKLKAAWSNLGDLMAAQSSIRHSYPLPG